MPIDLTGIDAGDLDALAARVRGWLEEHLPAPWRQAALDGDQPALARVLAGPAVTGAWYEVMSQMGSDKVLTAIAAGAQDTLASYKEQLSTTKLFNTPQAALQFTTAPDLKTKMDLVRQFCFTHQLLGDKTKSVDEVAIKYPDGSVQGKPDRVRLRFDITYMQQAAEGHL